MGARGGGSGGEGGRGRVGERVTAGGGFSEASRVENGSRTETKVEEGG